MFVCVCDQIELSVEKLQQDPLVSFSSFPVEFVNVEEILRQQLFSGPHIDNDVSVEEIVSCTITTRAVLGSDNWTSFWETQIKVSENFVLSSNLSVPFSSNFTPLQSLLFYPLLFFFPEKFRSQQKYIRWDCMADHLTLFGRNHLNTSLSLCLRCKIR